MTCLLILAFLDHLHNIATERQAIHYRQFYCKSLKYLITASCSIHRILMVNCMCVKRARDQFRRVQRKCPRTIESTSEVQESQHGLLYFYVLLKPYVFRDLKYPPLELSYLPKFIYLSQCCSLSVYMLGSIEMLLRKPLNQWSMFKRFFVNHQINGQCLSASS